MSKTFERKPWNGGGKKPPAKPGGGKRNESKRDDVKRSDSKPKESKPKESQIPSLARRIALDALIEVENEGAFSTLALDRSLSAYPSMSRDDKRLATALFYGVIERKMTLDYILKQFMQREPEDVITYMILRLAVLQMIYMTQIPDYAACGEAVAMARYKGREPLCPLVNAVTREISRSRMKITWPEDSIERLAIETSTPEWLVKRMINDMGEEETKKYLSYTPERYAAIRINTLQANEEAVREALTVQGMTVTPSLVPGAFRVSGGPVADTKAFHEGMFSIQGEASMLAALAVGVKGGDQVLDACAAPGGKACMLAEIMRGSGRVHAMDIHPHRIKLIEAQARRLKLDNIRPRVADATETVDSLVDSLNAVLVDAPCSGLGVIAGKPDIKYNLTQEHLDALPHMQLSILEACAQYVRRGGALVYSTCTILDAENMGVLRPFLDKHPEFALRGLTERLPEAFRDKVRDGTLSLMPHRDGTDGFFIARMERIS